MMNLLRITPLENSAAMSIMDNPPENLGIMIERNMTMLLEAIGKIAAVSLVSAKAVSIDATAMNAERISTIYSIFDRNTLGISAEISLFMTVTSHQRNKEAFQCFLTFTA